MGQCCCGEPKKKGTAEVASAKAPGKKSTNKQSRGGGKSTVSGKSLSKRKIKSKAPEKSVSKKRSVSAKKKKTETSTKSKLSGATGNVSVVSGLTPASSNKLYDSKTTVSSNSVISQVPTTSANTSHEKALTTTLVSAVSSSTLFSGQYSSVLSTASDTTIKKPQKDIVFRQVPITTDFAQCILARHQSLEQTANGKTVNRSVVRVRKMFTLADLEKMRANDSLSPDTKLILRPPFSNLDQIVPGLYLTGFCGTSKEQLREAKIELLINATWELDILHSKGLASYRVPVDDAPEEPIGRYFDDVADLIESTRRRGAHSLVHCLAGVSRSATLVLAYLVKHTNLDLHEAFVHLHNVRSCIRPNMGFFGQLIDFEGKLRGSSSTQLVAVKHPTKKQLSVTVPDFYSAEFPKLLEAEFNKQHKI